MTFRSGSATRAYRPMEVIEAHRPEGDLVHIDAPRWLIEHLQRLPGGDKAIGDDGVVAKASETLVLIVLVAVALAISAAAWEKGYQDGKEAGSEESSSEEDSGDTGEEER